MTLRTRIALTFTALVLAAPALAMKPPKADCDASVATVQAAVLTAGCDCATAPTHGQFVRCASHVVKMLAADGMVPKNCKGAMVRGYAKSSCGKVGRATCCLARPSGTKCTVKTPTACAKAGGSPGATPMCIDACLVGSPSGAFVH